MTLALICVDPARIASTLDGAATTLAPEFAWLVLHVIDDRPLEEWSEMAGRLAGRGPGRDRAAARLRDSAELGEEAARAAIDAWLVAHGRAAEALQTTGPPEQEIVRVALDRGADLIVLGVGGSHRPRPGTPPRPPKPPPGHRPPHPFGPPQPPGPVARFVIDHAPVDILLLRGRRPDL